MKGDNGTLQFIEAVNRTRNWRRRPCGAEGLGGPDVGLLLMLFHKSGNKPLTISEISDKAGVTRSSVTQQVNRLSASGYLKKQKGENDRRMVYVSLAPRALSLIRGLDRRRNDDIAAVAEYLGGEDTAELTRILNRINDFYKSRKPEA